MKRFLLIFIIPLFFLNSIFSQKPLKPLISKAFYFDVSPPLRNIRFDHSQKQKHDQVWKEEAIKNPRMRNEWNRENQIQQDRSIQDFFGKSTTDTTLRNFEGIANVDNEFSKVPPDPCGDIGPNHYVQIVNLAYAVYSRNGDKLLGPSPSSLIWYGLPYSIGYGDGVVLYDEQADRWFISQFSFPNEYNSPFYQMIAVSQTPDPTGSWYRWEYLFTQMPDYPKFGIWPDGYYMSCNRFAPITLDFQGDGAIVFDRIAMLAGDPDARMVMFTLSQSDSPSPLLPADCDGPFPTSGTPNYFTFIAQSYLGMYDFHVNWSDPLASTFGNLCRLQVSPFNTSGSQIRQKNTSQGLDPLNDRLMYRLQYRELNDHKSMVVNHTVSVGSHYGIRWYELRKTSADWFISQQSTYSPDTNSRWMGSIAMDTSGNIALGFSVSSSLLYPSIRFTGRMKYDPPGQMTIAEQTIINGSGSQTGVWSGRGRWGDYSSMSIDPIQPKTFWYTQEYYSATSTINWQTRISSFSFAGILNIHARSSLPAVCTGGSVQLNVDVDGVTGNSDYFWTSIPSGFTSNLKNPVASPLINTKYIVQVTNNTQSRLDTITIAVIPVSTIFAGKDTSYCINITQIPLKGSAVNYIYPKWVTSGDGTFTDPYALNTFYIPGSIDKSRSAVDLELTVYPQPPCKPVSGMRHIELIPCK